MRGCRSPWPPSPAMCSHRRMRYASWLTLMLKPYPGAPTTAYLGSLLTAWCRGDWANTCHHSFLQRATSSNTSFSDWIDYKRQISDDQLHAEMQGHAVIDFEIALGEKIHVRKGGLWQLGRVIDKRDFEEAATIPEILVQYLGEASPWNGRNLPAPS